MATYIIYSDTADDDIYSSNATYLTARSGSGLTVSASASAVFAGQLFMSSTYYVYEGFVSFDTSSVPGGAADSVTLSLYPKDVAIVTGFTVNARAKDWGTTVNTGDWVAGASLSALALRASKAVSSSTPTDAYLDFTSDASFPTNVGNPVRLLLSSSLTEAGTAPGAYPGDDQRIGFWEAETAGTTQDPKLTIVVPDPPLPPFLMAPRIPT